MAATSWFAYDKGKSRNLSVSISHVSVELFMRLRLVSVVGEFLWSGKRFSNHDVWCFPGGHCNSLGVLFQSSRSLSCLQSISIWQSKIAVWTTQKHVPCWDLSPELAGT